MNEGFSISYHNGWAMLTVFPQQNRSREIYADQIANRMKILDIPPVRLKIIEEIIQKSAGIPEKLSLWPEGESLSAMAMVTLSEDKMRAFVKISPPRPGGEEVTLQLIEGALESAGVIYGVDYTALERMVGKKLYNKAHLVAQGKAPVQGMPARIKYHFITEKKPYKELPYRRIDLKELNFIQDRNEGDLLAELLPPVQAVEGKTVTGESLEIEGLLQDEVLCAGANTEIRENKIYAVTKGNACLIGKEVIIESLMKIKDVDYHTGNIEFDGSVMVKGTVADGFYVKATGDIDVGKCVGRVELKAGRNLILKSGVNGDHQAQLFAGGDCISRYIEGASLICKGNLSVQESIMHSNLSVWGNVMLAGGRAELIGGSLLVQGSLWCRKLGGLYETPTAVILGISPDILKDYSHTISLLNNKRYSLDQADLLLNSSEIDHVKREALLHQIKQLSEEVSLLQQKQHQIKRECLPRETSLLVAEDRIYGGVKLTFGFMDHPVDRSGITQVILRFHKGYIRQNGFNAADPPEIDLVENP